MSSRLPLCALFLLLLLLQPMDSLSASSLCPYPSSSSPTATWSLGCSIAPALSSHASLVSPSPFTNVVNSSLLLISPTNTGLNLTSALDTGGGAAASATVLPSAFTAAGFTLGVWIYFNTLSTAGAVLFERRNADASQFLRLTQNPAASSFQWSAAGAAANCALPALAPQQWYLLSLTVSASGSASAYVNGVLSSSCTFPALTVWMHTVASIPSPAAAAGSFDLYLARMDLWDGGVLLSSSQILSLAQTPPASVSFPDASCVYSQAFFYTSYNTPALYSGHRLNTLSTTGTAGYAIFNTAVDPAATANGGANSALVFSYRDALNFRGPGDAILLDMFPANTPMETLTIAMWVRCMDSAAAALFDWRDVRRKR